ncbi:YdiK family protein [Virgibacillus ainsalahensis]
MKMSPLAMAVIYFSMGVLFIYVAIQYADDTIWNVTTLILAAVAALDFGVGIRMIKMHFSRKK